MAEDEKPSPAELNRRKLQASLESPRLGVPEKQRPPWVYTVPYSVKRNDEWSDGKIGIALLHEYDGSIARDRRYISETVARHLKVAEADLKIGPVSEMSVEVIDTREFDTLYPPDHKG